MVSAVGAPPMTPGETNGSKAKLATKSNAVSNRARTLPHPCGGPSPHAARAYRGQGVAPCSPRSCPRSPVYRIREVWLCRPRNCLHPLARAALVTAWSTRVSRSDSAGAGVPAVLAAGAPFAAGDEGGVPVRQQVQRCSPLYRTLGARCGGDGACGLACHARLLRRPRPCCPSRAGVVADAGQVPAVFPAEGSGTLPERWRLLPSAPAAFAGSTCTVRARVALGRCHCAQERILVLEALLLLSSHRRIALGHAAPFELALGVQLVPLGRERGQHLFLLGIESFEAGDGAASWACAPADRPAAPRRRGSQPKRANDSSSLLVSQA